MAIQGSPEAIREMRETMNRTIYNLNLIANNTRQITARTKDWAEDAQGAEFHSVMREAAILIEQPTDPLRVAIPKLQRIEEALRRYQSIHF